MDKNVRRRYLSYFSLFDAVYNLNDDFIYRFFTQKHRDIPKKLLYFCYRILLNKCNDFDGNSAARLWTESLKYTYLYHKMDQDIIKLMNDFYQNSLSHQIFVCHKCNQQTLHKRLKILDYLIKYGRLDMDTSDSFFSGYDDLSHVIRKLCNKCRWPFINFTIQHRTTTINTHVLISTICQEIDHFRWGNHNTYYLDKVLNFEIWCKKYQYLNLIDDNDENKKILLKETKQYLDNWWNEDCQDIDDPIFEYTQLPKEIITFCISQGSLLDVLFPTFYDLLVYGYTCWHMTNKEIYENDRFPEMYEKEYKYFNYIYDININDLLWSLFVGRDNNDYGPSYVSCRWYLLTTIRNCIIGKENILTIDQIQKTFKKYNIDKDVELIKNGSQELYLDEMNELYYIGSDAYIYEKFVNLFIESRKIFIKTQIGQEIMDEYIDKIQIAFNIDQYVIAKIIAQFLVCDF